MVRRRWLKSVFLSKNKPYWAREVWAEFPEENQPGHGGHAVGDGARLVEHHRRHLMRVLQRLSALEWLILINGKNYRY